MVLFTVLEENEYYMWQESAKLGRDDAAIC